MVTQNSGKYDLEERTTVFSEKIISLSKKSSKNITTNPIIDQLVRCGTRIGANYFEANGACSKKDFRNKKFLCKKESKETQYWLRILGGADENIKTECRELWLEAGELVRIFGKIAANTIVN